MDVILGRALAVGPFIPKSLLGSFPLLVSVMDVTLGWALGPRGALSFVIPKCNLGSFPVLSSYMDVTFL
eukprot:3724898-Karenia_brevis.AAC.1